MESSETCGDRKKVIGFGIYTGKSHPYGADKAEKEAFHSRAGA